MTQKKETGIPCHSSSINFFPLDFICDEISCNYEIIKDPFSVLEDPSKSVITHCTRLNEKKQQQLSNYIKLSDYCFVFSNMYDRK